MKTLETDIEIGADGSVRLLSPLPVWLKPGRAHVPMATAKPDFLVRQQVMFGNGMLPDSQAILDELRADYQ